jgi:hypothetical protein
MTKDQIDAVLHRVRSWPRSRQEDAAQMLIAMEAEGTTPYLLSEDEQADLERALREAASSEFAPDADVAALFARHRE